MLISALILFILGLSVIRFFFPNITNLEKVGLSFIIGVFVSTLEMLIIDLIGLPLTKISVILPQLFMVILLSILINNREKKGAISHDIFNVKKLKNYFSLQYIFSNFNLIWFTFIIAIIIIEVMNFAKCIYFPTFDRDSLAGFDTIGYIAAQEHTYKNLSIFNGDYIPAINGAGSYITYAPMVQLSYAYTYLLGAASSKIIPAMFFLSFIISFYATIKRVSGKTAAAIITFFVTITPEMIAFSSLSATNVIHSVYASLGVIYIALWFNKKKYSDLILGSLLLGANMWTRTDGIVFIGAAMVIVIIDAIRTKKYKYFISFLVLSFTPALFWVIFQKITGIFAESIAITHLFYDEVKLMKVLIYILDLVTHPQYYGWTFLIFGIAIISNIYYLIKKADNLDVLSMIIMSMVAYMIIIYQIDYKWDTIENVLMFSAKRFFFCFVPLIWFYFATNKITILLFNKIDSCLMNTVSKS